MSDGAERNSENPHIFSSPNSSLGAEGGEQAPKMKKNATMKKNVLKGLKKVGPDLDHFEDFTQANHILSKLDPRELSSKKILKNYSELNFPFFQNSSSSSRKSPSKELKKSFPNWLTSTNCAKCSVAKRKNAAMRFRQR